jgi:DNA-binding SARP family transcriptional activator
LAQPRIYLTGGISIECENQILDERHLPGRQGRLAFAFLTAERHRPISRHELATALWDDGPPREQDTAIDALLSKLRTVLKKAGLASDETAIDARGGSVKLRLPASTWVDIEEAADSIDKAEGAIRAGNTSQAWAAAVVAITISRRSFLGDEEAAWIEARRARLKSTTVRGLQCLSEVSTLNGELPLAVQYATEIVDLEPFRETAYQNLMRLQARLGNRAEALRVFTKCRELLRDELGASPSPATEALFLEIMRAAP